MFAALEVLTGNVTTACMPRKRTGEVLKFMNKIARNYPKKQEIHVVLDNISTHKNGDIAKWLEKHPNFTFHYTPTGSSWINQIENWFGIITRQEIRRGSFKSLAQLISRIDDYVAHWNEDADVKPKTRGQTSNDPAGVHRAPPKIARISSPTHASEVCDSASWAARCLTSTRSVTGRSGAVAFPSPHIAHCSSLIDAIGPQRGASC